LKLTCGNTKIAVGKLVESSASTSCTWRVKFPGVHDLIECSVSPCRGRGSLSLRLSASEYWSMRMIRVKIFLTWIPVARARARARFLFLARVLTLSCARSLSRALSLSFSLALSRVRAPALSHTHGIPPFVPFLPSCSRSFSHPLTPVHSLDSSVSSRIPTSAFLSQVGLMGRHHLVYAEEDAFEDDGSSSAGRETQRLVRQQSQLSGVSRRSSPVRSSVSSRKG
jgi:hypothetical protein